MTTATRTAKPKSEMWQRIRAARTSVKKTQLQTAQAIGKSRALVALWESVDPGNRTQPKLEELNALAVFFGVPVSYLMDDTARVEDIDTLLGHTPAEAVSDPDEARAKAFWSSVQFNVLLEQPEARFQRPFKCGEHTHTIPFVKNRSVVEFAHVAKGQSLADAVMSGAGKLLVAERIMGKATKVLAVYAPTGTPNAGALQQCCDLLGVQVVTFRDPQKAAAYLLAL